VLSSAGSSDGMWADVTAYGTRLASFVCGAPVLVGLMLVCVFRSSGHWRDQGLWFSIQNFELTSGRVSSDVPAQRPTVGLFKQVCRQWKGGVPRGFDCGVGGSEEPMSRRFGLSALAEGYI
jgi:hypothetical protein